MIRYFDYFGYRLEVFEVDGGFMFRIRDGAAVHHFVGIPNYCFTWRQAMMRGWYRCKWMSDGTFSGRYK